MADLSHIFQSKIAKAGSKFYFRHSTKYNENIMICKENFLGEEPSESGDIQLPPKTPAASPMKSPKEVTKSHKL